MNELPSGRVTFVFTDIEGSTRLFQRLGPLYRDVLEAHRGLLRSAFQRHRGVELGTEGDSFFVVFAEAADAIAATVEAQLALMSHDWPADAELRVRMGVHTGHAEPVNGDYVAIAVHQAARVAAAGHGGQVLVSEAALRGLESDLAAGVGATLLGLYRLKDFDKPQPLHQMTHPSLPADFPALRAAPAEGHTLPLTQTSLLGREAELLAVLELMKSKPIVTITGPGGVGKTRLAIEAARRALPSFAGGAWFVPLAPLTDATAVPAAVAGVLGVREEPGRALSDTLIDALGSRPALVVLDNCEHVADACSELVAALLRHVPDLAVLATSREPLSVTGESVYALAPLGLPDPHLSADRIVEEAAVQLFLERADAAGAPISMTPPTAEVVARICCALDGLPLALELAAARASTLSPSQILERLEHRLALLSRGARDAPDRQRTLRGAIDWSYQLLNGAEQRLLRQLSVFPAGLTLESAEEVADAEIDALQSLVDKSLVRRTGGRFTMLETIREFALEELERAGEGDEQRRRHVAYWAATAVELGRRARRSEHAALAQADAENDNVIAAFDCALDGGDLEACENLVIGMWYVWIRRGLTADGYRRARTTLDRSPDPSPRFVDFVSELARFNGDVDRAVALKRQAIAGYEASGAPSSEIAGTLTDLAESLIVQGHLEEAEQVADRALAMRTEEGEQSGIAHARAALIQLALRKGENARAAQLSDLSIAAFRDAAAWHDLAWEYLRSAAAYGRDGQLDLARTQLRNSFSHGINIADAALLAAAVEQAAAIASIAGDHENAMRFLGASRAARASTGYVFAPDETAMASAVSVGDQRDELLLEGEQWDFDDAVRRAVESLG